MAKLYISEYSDIGGYSGDSMYAAKEPCIVSQTITISGSSTQSAAFNSKTRLVRIHTDAICSVAFGSSPTATTDINRMAANQTEYWGVNPGDKVAVIANT